MVYIKGTVIKNIPKHRIQPQSVPDQAPCAILRGENQNRLSKITGYLCRVPVVMKNIMAPVATVGWLLVFFVFSFPLKSFCI